MHEQGCDIKLTIPGIHIYPAVIIPCTNPDDGDRGYHQENKFCDPTLVQPINQEVPVDSFVTKASNFM
jgi:hypothetical protein